MNPLLQQIPHTLTASSLTLFLDQTYFMQKESPLLFFCFMFSTLLLHQALYITGMQIFQITPIITISHMLWHYKNHKFFLSLSLSLSLSCFHTDECTKGQFWNVQFSSKFTYFPGLEHMKQRNAVLYKLHNGYSQLQANIKTVIKLGIKKHSFNIISVLDTSWHTASQTSSFAIGTYHWTQF